VIDSYAWIEQFSGTANAVKLREIFLTADELYTPDVVVAEVARKYVRDKIDDNIVKVRLQQIGENSKVVYLSSKLAFDSAKCYSELLEHSKKNRLNTPSLTDAIILATARMFGAKVLSGDQHFKPFGEAIWV
jgi:predicted nucleic acid-binding protein